jgi:poly(3-hydroxybutyrate) depolymerase
MASAFLGAVYAIFSVTGSAPGAGHRHGREPARRSARNRAAGRLDPRTLGPGHAVGANYDIAEFRLWLPPGEGPMKAILVLTPGSNGDGRAAVDKPEWQAFATRERVALVGVHLADKPPRGFIEQYIDVKRGSGEAFLTAIARLGQSAGHRELATAPLLLWGMSAGGEFNYEFVAWKPERVAAFVVNKGGVYYSGILSDAARKVPGMLFIGETDMASRKAVISGLFLMNRRAGAQWGFVQERGLAHVEGHSPELARAFFSDILGATRRDGWRADARLAA